jgi:O-antigen/teichoic acid export membrane protein
MAGPVMAGADAAGPVMPGPVTVVAGRAGVADQSPGRAAMVDLPDRSTGLARPIVARGAGVVVQLVSIALVTRLSGAVGIGHFLLGLAWIAIASSVLGRGSPAFVLRELSDPANQRPAVARAAQLGALRRVAGAAAALLLATLVVAVAIPKGASAVWDVRLAFAAVLGGALLASTRINSSVLKALGRPSLGLLAEFAFAPSVLAVVAASVLVTGAHSSVEAMLAVYVGGLALAAAASSASLLVAAGRRRAERAGSGEAQAVAGADRRPPARLWAMDLTGALSTSLPIVLAALVIAPADVGYFALSRRLVGLSAVLLSATASVFSPSFARAKAAGDLEGLRQRLRASQVVGAGLYAPFLVAFLAFGRPLLHAFSGLASLGSAPAVLAILAVAHLSDAATGLPGQFLVMVGSEKVALRVVLAGRALLVVCAVLLGSFRGPIGFALGYAIAVSAANAASLLACRSWLRRRGEGRLAVSP